MKKLLLSSIIISILQIGNAYSACKTDTTSSTAITGGSRKTITCAYISPNCVDGCRCCMAGAGTSYSCTCNIGYYAKNQNTASCSCGACPANSTCTSPTNFTCNSGYVKNSAGTGCEKITCPAGQYLNNSACTDCPPSLLKGQSMNITSNAGSTSITDCYATGGTDSTGTYTFTEPCHYKKDSAIIGPLEPFEPTIPIN